MNVDLRLVQAFVAVMEERSFTRAAERLHIGQSGLSQQIKRLERQLGGDLFVRTSKEVDVTALGAALYGPAQQVLAAVEHLERTAGVAQTRTVLRLGVAENGVNALAIDMLARLRASTPALDLRIERVALVDQHRAIEGELDAIVARPPFAGSPPADVKRVPLATDPLVVAAHENHALAGRGDVDTATVLAARRLALAWLPASWPQTHPALSSTGDDVEYAPEIQSFREALAWIVVHESAVVVPASFARTYRMPGLVSVPIADADPMTIELMTAGDDAGSPAAALAQLISEQSDDGRIDAEEWAHG